MDDSARKIYSILTTNNVNFKSYDHQPVITVDDVRKADLNIPGVATKNLFLKDKTNYRFFILISTENRKINLRTVAYAINSKRLSFATPEELSSLNLEPGFVGPLGVINDTKHQVIVLFDKVLKGRKDIHVSANSLTTTFVIDFDELCTFISTIGNDIHIINLD